jgi:hypothetical protein
MSPRFIEIVFFHVRVQLFVAESIRPFVPFYSTVPINVHKHVRAMHQHPICVSPEFVQVLISAVPSQIHLLYYQL